MKRLSRIISTLALLLLSLSAVPSAHAMLKAVSPNLNPATGGGGHPTWYQDQNSVAVQPLGIPATGFPVGFPPEWFYYLANSAVFPLGVSGETAFIIMALEATYADGNPASPTFGLLVDPAHPNAKAMVFQRLRIRITPPTATGLFIPGDYTLDHPWGTTVFTCSNPQNNKDCQATRDLPVIDPFNFAGALGGPAGPLDTTMSTFPRSTTAVPPFLGDGISETAIDAGAGSVRNSVAITGPLGSGLAGSTNLFAVLGKTLGIDVAPGTALNLGKVTIPATSVAKTVTVTNTTGNPISFPALATLGGADAVDFAVAPPAAAGATDCLTATVPASGVCSFDITFVPTAVAKAARVATVVLTPTNTPVVVGASNPPPVTINLSGTAQYPLTVAAATTDSATGPVGANAGNGSLTGSSTGQPSLVCSNAAAVAAAGTAATVLCTASFDVGSVVTLTPAATQSPLSRFDGWGGLCSGAGACTVTMDAATAAAAPAVTASFIEMHVINTTAIPAAGGTITPTLTVPHGSTPTIVITPTVSASPRISYRLGSVTDSAGPVTLVPVGTISSSYTLPPVVNDHNINANFIQQFILTPTIPLVGGVITPATVQTVDAGATQDFVVTADPGFRIGTVLIDGVAQVVPAAATTFPAQFAAVAGDHTLSASFVKIWNVASTVAGNGSVDKTGTLVFDQGATPSYTFTPDSRKFQVGKILLDNVAQTFTKPATFSGAVTFTLPAVAANKSVSAVFVPSGDLDASGNLDVSDALKALKIFVSILPPDSTDLAAMKIGPLDSAGIPTGGSGAPDLNDIILILKRAVGAVSW